MIHTQELVAPARRNLTGRLAGLFTGDQLDAVIDRAAGASKAVVAVFAASPVDCWNDQCDSGESAAVEWVVEFLVPPPSLEVFHQALETELQRASRAYALGLGRGVFAPCVMRTVSGGAFHQFCAAGRRIDLMAGDWRWSRDRAYITGLLHQARIGWRSI